MLKEVILVVFFAVVASGMLQLSSLIYACFAFIIIPCF